MKNGATITENKYTDFSIYAIKHTPPTLLAQPTRGLLITKKE
ncbi:MAG: hypothetical protein RSB20_06650 [Clostridia bacterium]